MPAGAETELLAGGKLIVDEPGEGVLRLTIDNPSRRNALDEQILDAIATTLAAHAVKEPTDTRGRCVILTGANGMFSAGYDIGQIDEGDFERRAERLVAHPFTEAMEALDAHPNPTVAVLPGHAIGGGLELALACDLRLAEATMKLGMPPGKLGLVYSHTGLRRFLDAIGAPRTRELFLLGRYIDAGTALTWGLVNWVCCAEKLESFSLEIAGELAANAPLAQRGNKRILRALLSAEGALSPEVERELIELRKASFASRDLREGMRAFTEKRAPAFEGR